MKKLKKFENFKDPIQVGSYDGSLENEDAPVWPTDNDAYSEDDLEQYEISEENVKKMASKQKAGGGVIGFQKNEEAIRLFTELGYEIKYIKHSEIESDKVLVDDINNRAKVNYVVVYLPEDEKVQMEIMESISK